MTGNVYDLLRGGLIVSCQAPEGSPLRDPYILGRIASAAESAGAVAIRAEGLASIEAIKKEVSIPVIGLIKRGNSSEIYITPDAKDVKNLVESGADIIAIDATNRLREGGVSSAEFMTQALAAAGQIPIMADVDDLSSAIIAEAAGASLVGTTLSGYTRGETSNYPNIDLVRQLASALKIPIIAEGRYSDVQDILSALESGALAVCVGTALTDPWTLTKRIVTKLQ